MKLSGSKVTLPLARRIIGLPGHASSRFNRCVGGKLFGKTGSKETIRENFTKAAQECKGTKGK
jgi:hypothetical protein